MILYQGMCCVCGGWGRLVRTHSALNSPRCSSGTAVLVTVYGAPEMVAVMVNSMKLRSSTVNDSAVAITVQARTKSSWPPTMIGRRRRRPSFPTAASDIAPHTCA